MNENTMIVAVGAALGGVYLITQDDGSGTAGATGANEGGQQYDYGGGSGGLSGGTQPLDDSLTLSGQIDSLEEFDAEEHGDLFGVTGTIDQDLSGDEDLSDYGLTEYEGELLDDDGGD